MNNDLISREALKKTFTEECCGCCDNCSHCLTGYKCELIDNAPTVEYTFEEAFQKTVCEQRLYCPDRPKGEWEKDNYGDVFCSNCGFECAYNEEGLYSLGRFCHHCGADMRGKKND